MILNFLDTIRQWADENPTQPVVSGLYRRKTDGKIMRMTQFNMSRQLLQAFGEDAGMYDAAGFDIIIDDKQQN
jgi:hypothetical protein